MTDTIRPVAGALPGQIRIERRIDGEVWYRDAQWIPVERCNEARCSAVAERTRRRGTDARDEEDRVMTKCKHSKSNPHPDNVTMRAERTEAERAHLANIANETKASQRAVRNQIAAAKRIAEPALPIAARISPVGYTGPRGGTSTRRERREEIYGPFLACLVPWNVPDCDLTPDEWRERTSQRAREALK